MSFLLPPLPPHFEAALRDVTARTPTAREAAATRLGRPEAGREREAEAGLLRLLADHLPQVRAAALRSLAEIGSASAHDAVRACLEDPDALVRELSVVALAGIDHPARADALLAALDHPAPQVRFQAIGLSAELFPDVAAEQLLACSRDPDDRVREAATRALAAGSKRDGRATTRLHALLDDPAENVRFEAAMALAAEAPAATMGPLLAGLSRPDLRFDALEALAHCREPAAIEAIEGIGRRVLVPPVVNAMAGRSLLHMAERTRAVPCLRDALRALRGDGRNLALECVREFQLAELAPELERLARWPRGSDPETLVAACAALAPRAVAAQRALERLSKRRDPAGELARAHLAAGASIAPDAPLHPTNPRDIR